MKLLLIFVCLIFTVQYIFAGIEPQHSPPVCDEIECSKRCIEKGKADGFCLYELRQIWLGDLCSCLNEVKNLDTIDYEDWN
uniref:Venom protein n=1 Tax=Strongyloides stercoralis TaxID=6248 RepID=A0A0K0EB14_STRER